MQLNPRYGSDPIITMHGPPAAIAGPAIRQRRRLAATVASFTDDQWAQPSRCEGWSNRDVITHLDSTNTFWSRSIAAGLKGEPSRILTAFDPVTTPALIVAGSNDRPLDEIVDAFMASNEALVSLLASLGDDDWSALAEGPPGHVSVSTVAHHALWDCWVHERDVLVPLGITPDQEADEITACLRFVAALGPAFACSRRTGERGVLAVDVTNPDVSFAVEIGDRVVVRDDGVVADADLTLTGDAVPLLEALSIRRALDQPVPATSSWMIDGLSETFDAVR